jgi:hypothetical protein
VRYLTELKEVELNMRDVWDSTPLYYSCLCVCRYLTEHKEVELNMRDVWDSTPLYFSCLCVCVGTCAADFSLLNLPKGKSLGRSKPATNS